MNNWILNKKDLPAFLTDLNRRSDLWTPSTENGVKAFSPYRDGEIPECGPSTRLSLRSFFLPRCEVMYRSSPDPDGLQAQAVLSETRPVVFGVKSCDARAIRLNSRVFLDSNANHQDPYFGERVENTILVGWGCDRPGNTCFCHAVGGGPFGEEGLDALVVNLGENLLMKELTARAHPLFQSDLLKTASEDNLAAAEGVVKASRNFLSGIFNPNDFKIHAISNRDMDTLFDLSVWEETAQRCLNCGVCTYLCPTCTCFDVLEDEGDQGGRQFRCWDSCMFGLFTQHASGHNPRPGRPERIRQRFMHKLRYFPDRHEGLAGCVGCGRCVMACPVNIDIREIAVAMAESTLDV